MAEREHLDSLEAYLLQAPVIGLASHAMGGGGHPASYLVVLEGGVGCLAKRADVSPEASLMVARERAAWVLARGLGWQDMIAATVIREVPGPGGNAGLASVQVLWPANQVGVPEDAFPESDRWRAAIFDALVRSTDRHAGNWLAVPREAAEGLQRLKLIDHGHAFDLQRPVLTQFYLGFRGQEVPHEYGEALDSLEDGVLDDLLPVDERDAFISRLSRLRAGSLDINEP